MRWYVRIVFGLNTIYQVVIGLIALLVPTMMLGLYGATDVDKQVILLLAAMRGLGFYIVFGGIISALVAINPDRYPILLRLMAALAVLTLVGWILTLVFCEMKISQVGIDLAVQVLLLIGALGYYPLAKRAAAPKQ
jgi:hypothetical protein